MSDNSWFLIIILLSVVMFAGTPDLHDALINYANQCKGAAP